MSVNLDHLDDRVKEYVKLPNKERIEYIKRPRWIGHDKAKYAETMIWATLSQPRSARMKNVSIIGESGSGKTTLIRRTIAKYKKIMLDTTNNSENSIVTVIMPYEPDAGALLRNISEKLGVPNSIYSTLWERRIRPRCVESQLKKCSTSTIVMDDFQSAEGSGTVREQMKLSNMIMQLSNCLRISFVFGGTPQARHLLRLNDQLHARTLEVELGPLEDTSQVMNFYRNFVKIVPLLHPSDTDNSEIPTLLLERSKGRMDLLVEYLQAAAISAIISEKEMIDLGTLWESNPRKLFANPPYASAA